jgi:hypothetical protein
LLLLTWIVATAAATGLAWAGVRSVADNVAAPLPAPAITAGQTDTPQGQPEDDPSPTTESPAAPSTPPPDADTPTEPQGTVRTFGLVGGTATVSFSPTAVEVLSAVPAPGFTAKVEPEGQGTRVEFESAGHRSRLDAWWAGQPRHEIDEQARDGGNDSEDDDDRGDDSGDDN